MSQFKMTLETLTQTLLLHVSFIYLSLYHSCRTVELYIQQEMWYFKDFITVFLQFNKHTVYGAEKHLTQK